MLMSPFMCVKHRACLSTVLKNLTDDNTQESSFILLLSSDAGTNLKLAAKHWNSNSKLTEPS